MNIIPKYMETPAQLIPATLIERQPLTKDYVLVTLELAEAIPFLPGQYLNLKVENKFRPYSMVSLPDDKTVQLCVDISPNGPGSRFASFSPLGTQVQVLIPLGKFVLSPLQTNTLFVATGSGIAPIKPMIESLLNQGVKFPVQVVWGMKEIGDLFWQHQLEKLAQFYPNFSYIYCLSREKQEGENIFHGRVNHYLENQANYEKWQAYVCGNSDMVNNVTELLLNKGILKDDIHFEKYI